MHLVDHDSAETMAQRPRFSPLRMVARALAGWQGEAAVAEAEPEIAEAAPITAAERTVAPLANDVIPATGEQFLAIVNAILDLDGEAELETDDIDFDLATLIEDAREVFASDAAAKGVSLAFAIAPDACGAYRGDAQRLRHSLFNLISGGLKATCDDVLALTADWRGGVLSFHLDAPEASGWRRRASSRLALCRTSALSLGGEVRTSPGDGVELIVPLRRAGFEVMAEAEPAFVAEPFVQGAAFGFEPGLRILVAEPSVGHQQVLKSVLAGWGAEAVIITDPQEVATAWRDERWDALLIDIEAEATHGRRLVRSIRAAEAAARWPRMPILALAATARQPDEDFAAAIDGVVTKPIHARSLLAALETALAAAPAAVPATSSFAFRRA